MEEKFLFFPQTDGSGEAEKQFSAQPRRGQYACRCCGCQTLPDPPEEAVGYICPVCLWENDVFQPGEAEPSDENHGMTLLEGRRNYAEIGACRPELLRYARRPTADELPARH